jgi:hypothetical protein
MTTPAGSTPGTQPAGYGVKSIPNMTPQMQQLYDALLAGVGKGSTSGLDYLSKLASGDEATFNKIEAPAYESFNKTLGQIGSRFSQYGAQNSSAFENAVSGAGAQLATGLQGQRNQLMTDAINKLLGVSNQLLGQKPQENFLQKEDEGIDFAGILASVLPKLLALL